MKDCLSSAVRAVIESVGEGSALPQEPEVFSYHREDRNMQETETGRKASSRRKFLKGATAASVTALLGRPTLGGRKGARHVTRYPASGVQRSSSKKNFIGIQVGAVSFVDEGIDKVLDTFQEKARVNALLLAVFTYGRGIAGRQLPGQPLPDHGAQEYDTKTFHGGSYAAVRPQYYGHTIFKDFRAPDLGEFDLLASVVPKAKKRGMLSYCWFEDAYNPRLLSGFEKVAEVDVYGRRTEEACLNNPQVRDFLTSLVEDWIKSYDLDGVMWASERQGPLNNAIGSHHDEFDGRGTITCFCEYCTQKGRERGISVDRAREGFIELDNFVRSAWVGQRPSDGFFVTFWRLLLNYPEILAWEKLWTDGKQEVYGEIYGTVKSINDRVQVGWHIDHNNSFSPFYRAEQDYGKLRQTSDFLKIVMYNNCGGPRLANYLRNMHSTIFRDATPEEGLAEYYRIMGYGTEASFDMLSVTGLSSDYVARETQRAAAGVRGEIPIYSGIDIDIPTEKNEKKTQPSDVKAAVKAALTSGASGVILSRKYSEMRLVNLAAAGEALKELGIS